MKTIQKNHYRKKMKSMNTTKKRILTLVTVFLMLMTAAVLPFGQNASPFGAIKASAAAVDSATVDALKVLVNDGGTYTFTVTDGLKGSVTVGDVELKGTLTLGKSGAGTFTHTASGAQFALTGVTSKKPDYSITFDKITKYPVVTITAYDGDEIIIQKKTSASTGSFLTEIPTPTKDGYVFDKWYFLPDLSGFGVSSENLSGGTHYSDFTVYASWKKDPSAKAPAASTSSSSTSSTSASTVTAKANASGSLNSASAVSALNAAVENAKKGTKSVTVSANIDVTAVSASAIVKMADAAKKAGVSATLKTRISDETGTTTATLSIPVTATAKTAIKNGIISNSKTIDSAVAAIEKSSGKKVLASFKTQQATTFGVKVTFSFDTETLGLDDLEDGTVYIAIKRGDGKTVQITGTVKGGKLTFSTTSAGIFMISDKSFSK
jgi:hypothetical protein